MCHGRKPVECYYRATVVHNGERVLGLKFKSRGEETAALYFKGKGRFQIPWQDLTFV